ncbi:hypothetical protein FACS189421_13450 [Bacteroidia bacterium]|nr:hypothetical protein FACS189421_13450 [Bacteroidia bacterium]
MIFLMLTLLLWGAASVTAQEIRDGKLHIGDNAYTIGDFGAAGIWMTENLREIPGYGQKMVVTGNMVNTGKINSLIPVDLRGAGSKIDNVERSGVIIAGGLLVDAGTTLNNDGEITITQGPQPSHGTDPTAKYYNYPAVAIGDPDTTSAKYGYLYSWAAATNITSSITTEDGNNSSQPQVQGICPSGWHLPSDYEWTLLEKEIAMNATNDYSSLGANAAADTTGMATAMPPSIRVGTPPSLDMKMRAATKTWLASGTFITGDSHPAEDGGFWVLPAGNWGSELTPAGFGTGAYFWTSSSHGSQAYRRQLYGTNPGIERRGSPKYASFSVRCKKN